MLQRAGGERRRRFLLPVLLLDLGDDIGRVLDWTEDRLDFLLVAGLELLSLPLDQLGPE